MLSSCRILVCSHRDGSKMVNSESLVRVLLMVPSIQLELQILLLEKLPEYFDTSDGLGASSSSTIESDTARLVLNQFRWLDFLVDSRVFGEKLCEVLSVCPSNLKKEMIGSLPEMIGDKNNETVVESLKQMLEEDSSIIVSVLDCFYNLNLDEQLQEQVYHDTHVIYNNCVLMCKDLYVCAGNILNTLVISGRRGLEWNRRKQFDVCWRECLSFKKKKKRE